MSQSGFSSGLERTRLGAAAENEDEEYRSTSTSHAVGRHAPYLNAVSPSIATQAKEFTRAYPIHGLFASAAIGAVLGYWLSGRILQARLPGEPVTHPSLPKPRR